MTCVRRQLFIFDSISRTLGFLLQIRLNVAGAARRQYSFDCETALSGSV